MGTMIKNISITYREGNKSTKQKSNERKFEEIH